MESLSQEVGKSLVSLLGVLALHKKFQGLTSIGTWFL
jgi:hypothetical protein